MKNSGNQTAFPFGDKSSDKKMSRSIPRFYFSNFGRGVHQSGRSTEWKLIDDRRKPLAFFFFYISGIMISLVSPRLASWPRRLCGVMISPLPGRSVSTSIPIASSSVILGLSTIFP